MGCTSSSDAAKPGAPPMAATAGNKAAAPAKKQSSRGLIQISYVKSVPNQEYHPYGLVDPVRQMLEHSGVEWKFNGLHFTEIPAFIKAGKGGPMNSIPAFKWGDEEYNQTFTFMRAVGIDLGYYPMNDWKKQATVAHLSHCSQIKRKP